MNFIGAIAQDDRENEDDIETIQENNIEGEEDEDFDHSIVV